MSAVCALPSRKSSMPMQHFSIGALSRHELECLMPNNHSYSQWSKKASRIAGRPLTFNLAVLVLVVWLVTGPVFGFSDTWQLVINTGTTIVTFLMVFLIQNTQNRDTEAIHIKLDELIRATQGAHNALLDLEEMEERELDEFRAHYLLLARTARDQRRRGAMDTDTPEALP